jgi:TRAP-type C4-dicarboxylate transport system permease small subunit
VSFWKVVDWVVDSLSTVLLLAMSLILALEVVFRYVLNRPLVWTLEGSLFCFVWLMWIGAIGCIREERQIRIDFVEKYAPMYLRRILVPATTILSMVFLVLVIYYGVYVTESQMSAVFDILPFSRGVQYAAAPIGGTLMLLSLARVFVRQIHRYYPGQKG